LVRASSRLIRCHATIDERGGVNRFVRKVFHIIAGSLIRSFRLIDHPCCIIRTFAA
jgi:hypothetical protein